MTNAPRSTTELAFPVTGELAHIHNCGLAGQQARFWAWSNPLEAITSRTGSESWVRAIFCSALSPTAW